MDKTIIIYRSKTGFSRRCALWLGEDLQCRAADWSERKGLDLAAYSTVILVSGLYAGQMAGLKWLTKQLPRLEGKRVAAVALGASRRRALNARRPWRNYSNPSPRSGGSTAKADWTTSTWARWTGR